MKNQLLRLLRLEVKDMMPKTDVYDSDLKEDHKTIRIVMDTNKGEGHIINTTDGKTQHTDIKFYLTTICMKFY